MEYRAIAINYLLTARELNTGRVLLFTPQDITEAGHISPPSEIYLSKEDISQLYREFVANDEAEQAREAGDE